MDAKADTKSTSLKTLEDRIAVLDELIKSLESQNVSVNDLRVNMLTLAAVLRRDLETGMW